jgi:hypothetical protein
MHYYCVSLPTQLKKPLYLRCSTEQNYSFCPVTLGLNFSQTKPENTRSHEHYTNL